MKRVWLCTTLFICCVFCGCVQSSAGNGKIVQHKVVSPMDCVSLSNIRAPVFEEDFATVVTSVKNHAIQWGIGSGSVMLKESGYPGFGYPMVVQCDFSVVDEEAVCIVTSWGRYEYAFESEGKCFYEDGNLINSETGKAIVEWGRSGEFLVLWDDVSGVFREYVLIGGTEIVE